MMRIVFLISAVLFSTAFFSQEVVETSESHGPLNGRYHADVKGYNVGLINSNGDTIVPPLYQSIHMPIKGSPFIPVFLNDSTICYYDLQGKMVIKPQLNYIYTFQFNASADFLFPEYFIENRNFVCTKKGQRETKEIYIQNTQGQRLYKFSENYYDYSDLGFTVLPFYKGHILVKVGFTGIYNVIDTNGVIVMSISNEFLNVKPGIFPKRTLPTAYHPSNNEPLFLSNKTYSGTPPFVVVRLDEFENKKDYAHRIYEVYDREKKLMERGDGFQIKENTPTDIANSYPFLNGYKKIFVRIGEVPQARTVVTPKSDNLSSTSKVPEITVEDIAPESGITSKIVVYLLSKSSSSSLSVTKQTFSGLAVNAYETKTTNYTNTQFVGIWKEVHCFNKTKENIISNLAPKDYEIGSGDAAEMKREYSDFKKGKEWDKNTLIFNSYNEMLQQAKAKGIVKLFMANSQDYSLLQRYSKGDFQVKNYDLGRDIYYSGGMNSYLKNGQGTLVFTDRSISGLWKNGEPGGNMTVNFKNGDKYVGEIDGRYLKGNGTYYYSDGSVFKGEFIGDVRNGKGEYIWKDGANKKGYWVMGVYSENQDDIAHAKFISSIQSNSAVVNKAIRFVEYDGSFSLMNNPSHRIDTAFTIEMWVRISKSYKENISQNLVACLGDKRGYSFNTSNGSVFFQYYNNGAFVTHYSVTIASKQAIDDEKWHHLALVFEKKQITLYKDGFLAQTVSNRPEIDAYDGGIVFGQHHGMQNIYGEIDEVRFWNTARSLESIRENMFACKIKEQKGLLFHYDFSEVDTVRKIIRDVSGNNSNALYKNLNIDNKTNYHTPITCIELTDVKTRRKAIKDQLQNEVVFLPNKVELTTTSTVASSGVVNSNSGTVEVAKSKYEGPYVNGKRQGKGKYTFASGTVYEGDFLDDKFTGKGKMVYTDGTNYVGDFLNDVFEGKGVYTYSGGDKYEGEFKGGKKNGNGTYYFKNGQKYVGQFLNGKFEGEGTMYFVNGKTEKCIYSQDKCVTPIK